MRAQLRHATKRIVHPDVPRGAVSGCRSKPARLSYRILFTKSHGMTSLYKLFGMLAPQLPKVCGPVGTMFKQDFELS